MKSWYFLRQSAWWWGTAVFALIAVFGPYWIWNIAAGSRGYAAFFRFPITPNTVFDSNIYFQLISLLLAGVHTGIFGMFTYPLQLLIHLMPGASVPEIWIVSRFITTVLALWIGAWFIRSVTGASTSVSRWLILCFWLSFLLAIGLRPGVFSWYLPFGFLGLGLVVASEYAFYAGTYIRSIALGILALLVLLVYPWFFLFGAMVLMTAILTHVMPSHRKLLYTLLALVTLGVCIYALLLAMGTLSFQIPGYFLYFERNGIGFARIPLISNTVLASVLWLVLFKTGRQMNLGSWWIVLLVLWLSPPLVGVNFLNDHFITVVAMMSWVSLAAFVEPSRPANELTPKDRRIARFIAIFASLFFCYILQKAIRQIGKFDPYLIHLSIWMALAAAAWFRWLEASRLSRERAWRRGRWVLFGITFLLGSVGLFVVIRRSMTEIQEVRSHLPAIEWIRNNVSADQAICSDPRTAKILAAHDGHINYPTVTNLDLAETDDVQHRRLEIVGAAYDVVAAGDEQLYPFLINGVRSTDCVQFARAKGLLMKLGLTQTSADAFIGCHQQRSDAFVVGVMDAIRAKQVDTIAFRATCPWVVIPDDHKAFWTLPGAYQEIRVGGDISIWHIK